MSERLTLKRNQIAALLQKTANSPLLQAIPYATIQKLQWDFKNPAIQQIFLTTLTSFISKQNEGIRRLKWWPIVHLLLLGSVTNETSEIIINLIQRTKQFINESSCDQALATLDKYLATQVQLPFISFLKKLAVWKQFTFCAHQAESTDIGFSEVNKINEVLQLRKIFHNYGCYYPNHHYALNLFQTCLLNIKCLWMSVCSKIQQIIIQASNTQTVLENQCLLIKEAEILQDSLMEFVYGDKLSIKLPKTLLIKELNFRKPQIQQLQLVKKPITVLRTTMGAMRQPKSQNLSIRTVDTYKEAKQSINNQSRLNDSSQIDSEQQMEIMDTIQQLQKLLGLQNSLA